MRVVLELLRIIIIFAFLGSFGWLVIERFYTFNGTTESYSWLGALAILVLLFVLYRNKLQFSGFYKGEGRHKLPQKVSIALVSVSGILMILPFAVSFLVN